MDAAPPHAEPSPSTCSSSPSIASSLAESDIDAKDEAEKQVVEGMEFVLNTATKYIHVAAGKGLACGKPMPLSRALLSEIPVGSKRCARCF